ncbi:MAG: hypothetical protein FWC45_01800 [Treponema sp.]|nr:hypothetical protein [Treponema sp.]
MKRKYLWWVLIGLLAMVTAVSCKSTPPPPTEETPAPPVDQSLGPPDQASLDALNAAAARAEAARKLTTDFGGNTAFPSDWQSADSLYTQAGQQKNTSTLKATQESTARYNAAASAMEALRDKTLAQYYDNRQKELTAARTAAVNAGAADLVPDYLLQADNTSASALAKYQAKDYYAARDTSTNALSMYTILKSGLDAYKVREEISNRNFEVYDPQNIAAADDLLRGAAQNYSANSLAAAKGQVDQAALRYNQALKTGWQSYAAEKGANASTERQNALNLKANVAVRQDFNSAQTIFSQANTAFQAQRYEDAAKLYDQSQSMFEVVAQVALAKQQAAQAALDRANQKMTESNETARSAEVILEGGTK